MEAPIVACTFWIWIHEIAAIALGRLLGLQRNMEVDKAAHYLLGSSVYGLEKVTEASIRVCAQQIDELSDAALLGMEPNIVLEILRTTIEFTQDPTIKMPDVEHLEKLVDTYINYETDLTSDFVTKLKSLVDDIVHTITD